MNEGTHKGVPGLDDPGTVRQYGKIHKRSSKGPAGSSSKPGRSPLRISLFTTQPLCDQQPVSPLMFLHH